MSSSFPFLEIDDGIRAHIIENVGTILVGTRDTNLVPEITRGWGPTILPDGHTIDVCVSLSAGAKTLDNLRDNDELAVTFHQTVTYKTVQLKRRFLDSGELTPSGSGVGRAPKEYIDGTGEDTRHSAEHRFKDLHPRPG